MMPSRGDQDLAQELTRLSGQVPWGPLDQVSSRLVLKDGVVHVLRWCSLLDDEDEALVPVPPSSLSTLPLCSVCGSDAQKGLSSTQSQYLSIALGVLDLDQRSSRGTDKPWFLTCAYLSRSEFSYRLLGRAQEAGMLVEQASRAHQDSVDGFRAHRILAQASSREEVTCALARSDSTLPLPPGISVDEDAVEELYLDWYRALGVNGELRNARLRLVDNYPDVAEADVSAVLDHWEAQLMQRSQGPQGHVLVALRPPTGRSRREAWRFVLALSGLEEPWLPTPGPLAVTLPAWLVPILDGHTFRVSLLGPVGADPDLVQDALSLWEPGGEGPLASALNALKAALMA